MSTRIYIPRHVANPASAVQQAREDLLGKLRKFATAVLVRHRMVTKASEFVFDFRQSPAHLRNHVYRLASALHRSVVRTAPHLEHRVCTPRSQTVGYSDTKIYTDILYEKDDTATPRVLQRYLRLMKYYLRKNGVPLVLELNTLPASPDIVGHEKYHCARIYGRVAAVIPQEFEDIANRGISIQDWVASVVESTRCSPDSVYANDALWTVRQAQDLSNVSYTGIHPSVSRLLIVERFFLIMPQLIKSIQSILRRTVYAPTAFTGAPPVRP